jgi:hypothetical protein
MGGALPRRLRMRMATLVSQPEVSPGRYSFANGVVGGSRLAPSSVDCGLRTVDSGLASADFGRLLATALAKNFGVYRSWTLDLGRSSNQHPVSRIQQAGKFPAPLPGTAS